MELPAASDGERPITAGRSTAPAARVSQAMLAFLGAALVGDGLASWIMRMRGLPVLVGMAVCFGVGGWFAGRSLGRGARASAASAVLFAILGPLLAAMLVSVRGLTGREPVAQLLAAFCLYFATASVVSAAVVTALFGLGWRAVVASAAGYGVGGVFGGVVMAFTVETVFRTGSPDGLLIGHALATALPFAIGGGAAAYALDSPRSA